MSDLPPPPVPPYQSAPSGSAPTAASPYGPPPYTPAGTAQYGQVPGQPVYWSTRPPTNTIAIVALILGFVFPLGGIIAGHIALAQIKRTGEAGRGMALAGAILGYAYTGFIVLYIIVVFAMIATVGVGTSYYG
jgi:hypothetical protein